MTSCENTPSWFSRGSYSAVCSCLLQHFSANCSHDQHPQLSEAYMHSPSRCTYTHTSTHKHSFLSAQVCVRTHKQALIQWQHFTDNFPTLSGAPFPSCHIPHQSRSPSADTLPVTSALDLEFKQFHSGWIFHRHIMYHVLKETKALL